MNNPTHNRALRVTDMRHEISTQRLMLRLTVYFLFLFGSVLAVGTMRPELLSVMPMGGTTAFKAAQIDVDEQTIADQLSLSNNATVEPLPTPNQIANIVLFLALSLVGTLLVMLPITWTYVATRREIGFRKNFVRALMVLPICIGLAAGIGHLGIAAVMALFFCFTNVLLWHVDFGRNPIDEGRLARKHSALPASVSEKDTIERLL
ncbi:MAG: hypothetical protein KC572_04285 [Gammaproteobacteria bacterium]|nr:hypothetical protein [Gammaproteobacteria bacterium]